MDGLIHLKAMHPAQRPALSAGEPAVWVLQGQVQPARTEARRFLRDLLADYLATTPDQVPLRFARGEAPCVDADWQGMRLSISMSYGQDVALVALCPGARIGIDVTEVAPMPDWAQVARLYLGPESTAHLAALDGVSRDRVFAQAWAELEARGKCLGLGLQEWSPARQARLQQRAIQVSMGVLGPPRSGRTHACALAWHSSP